ncbi:hypothetical protein FQR65_LT15381 [Abscondita terminalis]|nr:hypothetical protein FQR65_LT15381 [Abscondita terminalis]
MDKDIEVIGEDSGEDVFVKFKNAFHVTLPTYLEHLLRFTGFHNVVSLDTLDDNDLKEIEEIARTQIKCLFPESIEYYLGCFKSDADKFRILPGNSTCQNILRESFDGIRGSTASNESILTERFLVSAKPNVLQNQEACDLASEEVNLHHGPTPNQIAQSKEIKSSIKILQNLVIPTTASSTLLDLAVEKTGIQIDYRNSTCQNILRESFDGIRGSTASNESILTEGFSVLPSCESYETNVIEIGIHRRRHNTIVSNTKTSMVGGDKFGINMAPY